jgi:Mg-chelatase subunit ChlD
MRTRIQPGSAIAILSGSGLLILLLLVFAVRNRQAPPRSKVPAHTAQADRQDAMTESSHVEDWPVADPQLCTAVIVLLDTSKSMSGSMPRSNGLRSSKMAVARDALNQVVDDTADWMKSHPDHELRMGILTFSNQIREVLKPARFQHDAVRQAVLRVDRPYGGTAIGRALEAGVRRLCATGCVRKHIVCITDGENTVGPSPDRIAGLLHAKTGGEVQLHFVAFDTSAEQFAFLKDVNGQVVQANDAQQLSTRLSSIYKREILAEAMPD